MLNRYDCCHVYDFQRSTVSVTPNAVLFWTTDVTNNQIDLGYGICMSWLFLGTFLFL